MQALWIATGSRPKLAPLSPMVSPNEPDHFETAVNRFRSFFTELQETFVERDSVLTQSALALLSRQHVLMTGPPGTAKSQLASLVLGRIIDESTGSPSLFSRQFTENTVQTDLIGSIDFKTLMESGRTEHFTDEGMLGSVHAFLDEVLDGRDMLLRSTLNILNERELKQGGRTTKGRIECAFMTSNRYISEVLDSSRDTLLAFIDRISFISFIPRGFSEDSSLSTVVRRHGGGFGRREPRAFLSVQDLDALQGAVDLTYVPEEICDAVAQLIALLDGAMAEAKRSDPKFQPTRYLSTRSAVQATEVLRAVVMFDKIFNRPDRALEVEHEDLKWLRYLLLLNGVAPDDMAECIARETDPRERRQLDIMATESEIFMRCLGKLPRVEPSGKRHGLALGELNAMAKAARSSGDPEKLGNVIDVLVAATESGDPEAKQAARLLVDTVGSLTAQALRAGLSPQLEGPALLLPLGEEVRDITKKLESSAGTGRSLAQWLRARLLRLLDDALHLTPAMSSETVEALAGSPSIEGVIRQIDARFVVAERMLSLRRQLLDNGATPPPDGDAAWIAMLDKLEEELVLLWDARLRLGAVALLGRSADTALAKVLHDLQPILADMQEDEARFASLGRQSDLIRRVTGPRLEPLVQRAFERLDGRDRKGLIAQVNDVVAELRSAGLDAVISPDRFVSWTAPALIRAEPADLETPQIVDRSAYDRARSHEPASCIVDTLVQVALASLSSSALPTGQPRDASEAVWGVLRAMPDEQLESVIELDLARIERGIGYLESWWRALGEVAAAREGSDASVALLEVVVSSGYLRAMRGDVEPLRIAAEIRHLAEALPASAERGAKLRTRLQALDTTSTQALVSRLQDRANRAWSDALAPETAS